MSDVKRIAAGIAAFIFVAACSVFIALATGVKWGTGDCGLAAYLGVVVGTAAAIAAFRGVRG